jgi:oligopeptide transport system permease protein
MQENLTLSQEFGLSDEELFSRVDSSFISSEKITAPRYSYWKSVARVFFKKKINWIVLSLLALIVIFAFVYPFIVEYDPFANIQDTTFQHLSPSKALKKNGFSIQWILGTGASGQSIFDATWYGAKTSLSLALICAAINMTIGIIIGAIWGFSKKVDIFMQEVYNIIANVPYILFISVFVFVIGSGFWPFVAALTVTGWLGLAYFIRTQVIIIRDREYNLASKCLGTPIFRLVMRNILPFLTSVIVTLAATEIPSYISYEVFLSFIGIGLSAKEPSLGRMISEAQGAFTTFPWEFWSPVFIASFVTVVLYIVGQNLGDASDPRTHM